MESDFWTVQNLPRNYKVAGEMSWSDALCIKKAGGEVKEAKNNSQQQERTHWVSF